MLRIAGFIFGMAALASFAVSTADQEEVWPAHIDPDDFENYQKAKAQYEAEQRLEERLNKFRSDIFAIQILNAGIRNPKILDSLDLTEEQENQLKLLLSEYRKKKEELKKEYSHLENPGNALSGKLSILNHELTARASEILVDFQLEEVVKMNILKLGAPHLLVDTKMGDALGLSEAAKDRIRSKANRISKKVSEFMHETRKKAFHAVCDELDQGQKQTLVEIYGDDVIKNYFEGIPMYSITLDYYFPEESDTDRKRESSMRTHIPELHTK